MQVKYRVRSWGFSPVVIKVEIVKQTEKFVFLKNGSREAINSNYGAYFDSFEEAKEFKINCLQKNLEAAKRNLQQAEEDLEAMLKVNEAVEKEY